MTGGALALVGLVAGAFLGWLFWVGYNVSAMLSVLRQIRSNSDALAELHGRRNP